MTMTSRDRTLLLFALAMLLTVSQRTGAVPRNDDTDRVPLVQNAATANERPYQLFIWWQSGQKDGYRFSDHPEFWVEGDVVKFKTDHISMSILRAELDRFTLEPVLPNDPTGFDIPGTYTVGLEKSVRLPFRLTPQNAVTSLTWMNSAPDVVSIDDAGRATGLKVGTATLTAQTSNGLRAVCQVSVPEPRWKLYVWLRPGIVKSYDLNQKPEITVGTKLFTISTQSTRLEFPATDVLQFTLDDGASRHPALPDLALILQVIATGGDTLTDAGVTTDVNADGRTDLGDALTVISMMAGTAW